jgi:hypothetical protein
MSIYFSFSLSQSDENIRNNCKLIITVLQETGSKIIPKNLLSKINNPEFHKHQTSNEKEFAQNELLKLKKSANIIVLETSFSSIGIGQELEYSIANNKPVLAIYHENYQSHILKPLNYDNFVLLSYNNNNLNEILLEGIEYLKKQQPKRFNLLIEANLLSYLKKSAQKNQVSSASYIRQLIIKDKKERAEQQ